MCRASVALTCSSHIHSLDAPCRGGLLDRPALRVHPALKEHGGTVEMDLKKGALGELIIEIGGSFDGKVAARLAGWLREIPRTDRLVIDFSQVRDFQDLGLACVARDLVARGSQLQVRGLTRHQERMMRYFGLELEQHPGGDADPVAPVARDAKATA